jgi:hypothetical protein
VGQQISVGFAEQRSDRREAMIQTLGHPAQLRPSGALRGEQGSPINEAKVETCYCAAARGRTSMPACVSWMLARLVSTTVIDCVPGVSRITPRTNECTPASEALNW